MTDVKRLKEFARQMDWEGGWQDITYHGHDGTGDDALDYLLEKFELILGNLDFRWDELNKHYGPLLEEEDESEERDGDL